MLGVEKWWAVTIVQLTGQNQYQNWTLSEAVEKFEILLKLPAEVRLNDVDSPLEAEVTLQQAIRGWDFAVQKQTLEMKINQLLIARMSQSIVDMNDVLDVLEHDDPEEHAERMLKRISTIRRNCLGLKRHMAPQHEALEQISRDAPFWFEEHDRREIAETIDRLRRYLDDIDVSKESAVVLMDELRTRALASNERATYMLTIVAGIFLPLGFLTGLLGINVGGMPGVNDGHAFWWVTGICLAIIAVLMAIFKRLKWL